MKRLWDQWKSQMQPSASKQQNMPNPSPAQNFQRRFPHFVSSFIAIVIGVFYAGLALGNEGVSRPILSEKDVVYLEIEGQKVRADIFRPADEELCPLVVMIHGGAWAAGDKWDLLDHAREMAQAGFVAVSINYRLAPGCQIDGQIEDCRTAIKWAVEHAPKWNADPQRVALWGYSAGAHLASLIALKREKDDPKLLAVVAGGAPCEFSFIGEDSQVLKYVVGGSRRDSPEAYARVSPVNYARKDAPAFFFFHGTSDWIVPPTSSKALFDQLKSQSVPVEYCSVAGKGHLLSFLDTGARQQAIEFLQQQLKETK